MYVDNMSSFASLFNVYLFFMCIVMLPQCLMCSQHFIMTIGIIEMSDEAVDEAIRVCDSNIRLRYVRSKNVHTRKRNAFFLEFYFLQFRCVSLIFLSFLRYVSALSDPESYLGSKNVPDVCVLIEKASNCVSSETAYDWYDHFKKNCQNWPVVYQTKETAKQLKEAKSTRKEPPVTQSKKVRE
jgi:hypothetical protein